jgi:hypothetical protein
MLLFFALAIYCIKIDSDNKNEKSYKSTSLVLNFFLPIILIFGVYLGFQNSSNDIFLEKSSSKKFAEFIQKEKLQDSILISEPDYIIEAIPYYLSNIKIFMPREGKYSHTASWSRSSKVRLQLDDIISTGDYLRKNENKTVLIILGFSELQLMEQNEIFYSYNKILISSKESLADFRRKTIFLRAFTDAITDEKYYLYKLK